MSNREDGDGQESPIKQNMIADNDIKSHRRHPLAQELEENNAKIRAQARQDDHFNKVDAD